MKIDWDNIWEKFDDWYENRDWHKDVDGIPSWDRQKSMIQNLVNEQLQIQQANAEKGE